MSQRARAPNVNTSERRKIKVYKFPITPEMLARIPIEERVFFLGIGHAANELAILRKLIILADRHRGSDDIERGAQVVQCKRRRQNPSLK